MTSEQRQMFRQARALIATRGWCQLKQRRDGAYALDFALERSYEKVNKRSPFPYKPHQWAKALGIDRLATWNDSPGRTQEEVVCLLDTALWPTALGTARLVVS